MNQLIHWQIFIQCSQYHSKKALEGFVVVKALLKALVKVILNSLCHLLVLLPTIYRQIDAESTMHNYHINMACKILSVKFATKLIEIWLSIKLNSFSHGRRFGLKNRANLTNEVNRTQIVKYDLDYLLKNLMLSHCIIEWLTHAKLIIHQCISIKDKWLVSLIKFEGNICINLSRSHIL